MKLSKHFKYLLKYLDRAYYGEGSISIEHIKGDGLAKFIRQELIETSNGGTEKRHLIDMERAMATAREELDNVRGAIQDLIDGTRS